MTEDLIRWLNATYPDRLSLVTALGSLERAEGAREVVEHLISLKKAQENR